MAEFKPIKTTSSKLDSLAKKEGQFIITTDDGKLYYDESISSRISIGNSNGETVKKWVWVSNVNFNNPNQMSVTGNHYYMQSDNVNQKQYTEMQVFFSFYSCNLGGTFINYNTYYLSVNTDSTDANRFITIPLFSTLNSEIKLVGIITVTLSQTSDNYINYFNVKFDKTSDFPSYDSSASFSKQNNPTLKVFMR